MEEIIVMPYVLHRLFKDSINWRLMVESNEDVGSSKTSSLGSPRSSLAIQKRLRWPLDTAPMVVSDTESSCRSRRSWLTFVACVEASGIRNFAVYIRD